MDLDFGFIQFYVPPEFLILFAAAFALIVTLKLVEQHLEMRSYKLSIRALDEASEDSPLGLKK